jgi:hypothetical protein
MTSYNLCGLHVETVEIGPVFLAISGDAREYGVSEADAIKELMQRINHRNDR